VQGRTVAVFGGSEHRAGSACYEEAVEAARVLGEAGVAVATGGYGGIMEAASRGASEAGGRVLAVTTTAFACHRPNRWAGEEVPGGDLFDRTRRLIGMADAFLLFPGRSGTLSEAFFVWALVRAGQAAPRPTAAVGEGWSDLLSRMVEAGFLEPAARDSTRVHASGRMAAEWLVEEMAARAPRGD